MMRVVGKLVVTLAMALSVLPAAAATEKDTGDCEQMTNPGLKVAACTRILKAAHLSNDLQPLGHHQLGVGLLLQGNYDSAIVEFNAALRADPANMKSYNSR